jgi:hypothetical protein
MAQRPCARAATIEAVTRSCLASTAFVALAWAALGSVHGCTCEVGPPVDEQRFDDDDDDDFGGDDDDDTPRSDCESACAQAGSNEGAAAQCYACRCKDAFDGWLPSPAELQCGAGVEVEVFASVDDQATAPVARDEYPSHCNNPSLFQMDCGKHARYGVIERGDVEVRFLCRHFNVSGPPSNTYDLVGVIGQNRRTGATCVWDAAIPLDDTSVPDLDITAATVQTREAFAANFVRTYGYECVYCHDNDPFIYTPYLKSVGWQTNTYTTGPYGFVQFDGTIAATGMQHLVGPPVVQSCTSCHRISSGETCRLFARDAVGRGVADGTTTVPHDFDPASAFAHAVWMPNDGAVDVVARPDPEAWETELGAARDKILECCDAVAGLAVGADCEWDDIPH